MAGAAITVGNRIGLSVRAFANLDPSVVNYQHCCLNFINYRRYKAAEYTNDTALLGAAYVIMKYFRLNPTRPSNMVRDAMVIAELYAWITQNANDLSATLRARKYYIKTILYFVLHCKEQRGHGLTPPADGNYSQEYRTQVMVNTEDDFSGFFGDDNNLYVAMLRRMAQIIDNTVGDNATEVQVRERIEQYLTGLTDLAAINDDNSVLRLCYRINAYFACDQRTKLRDYHIQMLVNTTVTYTKRSNFTDHYLNKITGRVNEEMRVNMNLDANHLRLFSSLFTPHVTDESMNTICTLLEGRIPISALSLRLMIDQCKWSGMLHYVTIRDALLKCADFPWYRLVTDPIYRDQFTNFYAAAAAVRDNCYYGYKKDNTIVRASNFPDLSAVCRRLLIDIGIATTLQYARGFKDMYKGRMQINQMIERYVAGQVGIAPDDGGVCSPAFATAVTEAINNGHRIVVVGTNILINDVPHPMKAEELDSDDEAGAVGGAL